MSAITIFSTVLSVGVLVLVVSTTGLLLGFFFVPAVRRFAITRGYVFYLAAMGWIATIATASVLIYQFGFGLDVCELCWWQRIFMFPIEVIVGVALLMRERAAHLMVGILATIGGMFAAYHYYNHFQNLILHKVVILPCSQIGLVPSCTDTAFVVFGFITIPFMALAAFVSLLALALLTHHVQKVETKV